MNEPEDKKAAIKGLARSYQEVKNYKNGIRCFKKLLELAWDTNDSETEVYAY